jgi:hypothetical protein
MRAPRYMGFPEKLDELMNFPKCVTDRQDRGQNQNKELLKPRLSLNRTRLTPSSLP